MIWVISSAWFTIQQLQESEIDGSRISEQKSPQVCLLCAVTQFFPAISELSFINTPADLIWHRIVHSCELQITNSLQRRDSKITAR